MKRLYCLSIFILKRWSDCSGIKIYEKDQLILSEAWKVRTFPTFGHDILAFQVAAVPLATHLYLEGALS
jgi:hypothetical protein